MGGNFKEVSRKGNRKGFRKVERIRKKKDFQRIKEEGKGLSSKNCTIIFIRNNLPYNRLAIGIGKKIGNAVIRNYEKRICREIYRGLKSSLPKGFDFLIIVKRASGKKLKKKWPKNTSSEFLKRKTELESLFNHIN